MNHRIFKLLRLLGAPLLAAAAVFGSCTTELESNEFRRVVETGKASRKYCSNCMSPERRNPGRKAERGLLIKGGRRDRRPLCAGLQGRGG